LHIVRSSCIHLCKNCSPSVIKSVEVKRTGSEFVLLEVDASDGVKMLSTKVLSGVDSETWRNEFEKIRRGVIKSSLNWPNSLFDQLYGQDGHRGVNHPKGLGELQVSREDKIGRAHV